MASGSVLFRFHRATYPFYPVRKTGKFTHFVYGTFWVKKLKICSGHLDLSEVVLLRHAFDEQEAVSGKPIMRRLGNRSPFTLNSFFFYAPCAMLYTI